MSRDVATHPFSGKALDSSEILVLSTADFAALRDEFPEFQSAMAALARSRYRCGNRP